MNPLIHLKRAIPPFVISFVLTWFVLSPQARAVCQQGCLTNGNTVLGESVLANDTTGFNNTAIGFEALFTNTTGGANTAIGVDALIGNTTGSSNTATGGGALASNTTGGSNTANGLGALESNTTGGNNTATGYQALNFNTTGTGNTANGFQALYTNRDNFNTASGYLALFNNYTANSNTATGAAALYSNSTGNTNTAEGDSALFSNTTGSSNIAVGASAGLNLTTGSNNIDIGNTGVAGESKTIRIGTSGTQTKTVIAGIFGTTVAGGVGVIVGSGGRLGTVVSSERFKDSVEPMDNASEAIFALKPVTFCYKKELDPKSIPQFGLVAEDVEKVSPDLVARDEQGKPYSVRYEAVNAMLLNEFLKEHRRVQELEANAARQQKEIEVLTAGLQKVSAQLELGKSAPQTVLNNH